MKRVTGGLWTGAPLVSQGQSSHALHTNSHSCLFPLISYDKLTVCLAGYKVQLRTNGSFWGEGVAPVLLFPC